MLRKALLSALALAVVILTTGAALSPIQSRSIVLAQGVDHVTNLGGGERAFRNEGQAGPNASFSEYEDFSSFEAAFGDPLTGIYFTEVALGTVLTTQYLDKGVEFRDGDDTTETSSSYVVDQTGLDGNGRIHIRLSRPASAIGVDFPGALTIDLYDFEGGNLLYTSSDFAGSGKGFFGGIVSDVGFSYVTLRDWVDDRVYADNVFFGFADTLSMVSTYAETPPQINGAVGFGEWQIANQLAFDHGFITVLNDATRLYMLVDVLDDTGNDLGDYFWLTFDVDRDGGITPNVDMNYGRPIGTDNMRYQYYLGPGIWTGVQPDTFSSRGSGFGCFFADGTLSFELFPFRVDCSRHRVWEFGIDLAEIGAEAGETVRVGLRVSSPNPTFTDEIPTNFYQDFSDLIQIALASPPIPIPVPHPSASIELETDAIEVTQAIQDRSNTLPLVQDKRTVARVYVDVDGVFTPQPSIVYLYGSKDGADLPGSPLSTFFMAPTSIDRSEIDDTVNFLLPSSWPKGTVQFRSRVVDLFGNADSSTPFSLTFTQKEEPIYWIIPINTGTVGTPVLVSDAEIDSQESYLETVYPVPDVRFVRKSWDVIGPTSVANTIDELNDLHAQVVLAWVLGFLFTGSSPFDLPDQVYGFTPSGGGISDPTWVGGNGYVARGCQGSSREGTMAHEINHNLDRSATGTWGRHTPFGCSASGPDPNWPYANDDIQEVGFDTRPPWVDGSGTRDTVVSSNFPDYMSYCQSEDIAGNPAGQLPTKWISPYRWQALFNHFSTATTARLLARKNDIQTVYYISGQVEVGGTGSLDPVLVQPGIPTADIAPGDYSIEIRDASSAVLSTTTFLVSFVNVEGEPVDTVHFHFQLPEQAGTAEILLKHGTEVLDTISVSDNAPTVTVLEPNGGEVWSDTHTISWEADDMDDDPLSFSILYTPDDGNMWLPVASGLTESSYEVNTTRLPAGDTARVRVIATDGFNTTQDDSDGTFTVTDKAPNVAIVLPVPNAMFLSGDMIAFQGDATDAEDESIPEESFIWTYDTTPFGTGRQVDAVLPDGFHQVTLTVVDSGENVGQRTILVFVGKLMYLPLVVRGA